VFDGRRFSPFDFQPFEHAIRLRLSANESGKRDLIQRDVLGTTTEIAREKMPVGTGKFHSGPAPQALNEVPPGQRA
jgi:hypothetical protein